MEIQAPQKLMSTEAGGGRQLRPSFIVSLTSGLILFLELSLIRWAGANIVHLSYFTNFILLGSFLGIGLGFLWRRYRSLLTFVPYILVSFVAIVYFFPVQIVRDSTSLLFFSAVGDKLTGLPIWAILPFIFVCVAAIFATLAQTLAQAFSQLPSLQAYRLDLLGSLAGIAVFSSISFLGWPPFVWGAIVGGCLLILATRPQRRLMVVPILAIVGFLGLESLQSNAQWSPYYKITTKTHHDQSIDQDTTLFLVNGIPHQQITPLALLRQYESFYTIPYQRYGATPPKKVLIIGAGTGTDVAVALNQGVEHVDAVEIDPVLARLGREKNPDRPYDDSRVSLYINDGRSYLERTKEMYDLIIFALPDSLTLVAGQSSLRLESYMFTKEAVATVARHLQPDGMFSMYNYYRQPWLIDRLEATMNQVFHRAPCVETKGQGDNFAVLSVAKPDRPVTCPETWVATEASIKPAADTYPFLYLHYRLIPKFYLLAIAGILLVSFFSVRLTGGTWRRLSPYADLFWMGAAFMALETKNVVHFALLFGTTWFVNALVFGGILMVVFLTVTLARRLTIKRYLPWYLALFASLAIAWVVPEAWLLSYAVVPRFMMAVVIAFLPIFLANCIFASRLRASDSSTDAMAANLIGAMVGGVLEYTSLIIGYQTLVIVVAVLYALALWSLPRFRVEAPTIRA